MMTVCNSNLIFKDINISSNKDAFNLISPEVKASWNWVGYRMDKTGNKIPVKATIPDVDALVDNDGTWVTFAQAIKALNDDEKDLDGIGLVIVRDGKNYFEYDDLTSVTLEDLAPSRFGNFQVEVNTPKHESLPQIDSSSRLTINLEESNFVRRYHDYCSSITDAYPEYHHAGALTLLSFAADRKVSMRLKNGVYYPNIWCLCLGQSTTSRKSTALGYVADLLDDENHERRLSDQFSPESFIEQMSSHPHSYLINDECGGLFKSLNKKPYMADLKDTLCTVYDNHRISRKLRTNQRDKSIQTDFSVKEPYLTTLFATTFESLSNSVIEDDFTSGLLPRFLPYYPEYIKDIRGVEDETEDDDWRKNDLKARFDLILDNISNAGSIRLKMSDTGKEIYNRWLIREQQKLMYNPDFVISSVFGRYQVYALKMAMHFTVGSEAFQNQIKELQPGSPVEYTIPDAYVIEAIREIDDYFIPTIVGIREKIANHGSENLQAKIIDVLKRSDGELDHSQLMKGCKLERMNKSRSQFHEAIETLIDMDMVTRIELTHEQIQEMRKKNKNFKTTKRYGLNSPSF